MRKQILLGLLLLLSALLLTACHGARDVQSFSVPERMDESRTYEIVFWAKNDTNKRQTDIYEKAIADFEALYPEIHVTLRLYTDYGKIYNDVITNIATNTTPNVCISYPDHIATYLTGSDVVVPLDELFQDAKYGLGGSEVRFAGPTFAEIIPEFLSECVIGDTHYALPYMRSTEAMYINKTYVEALGYELPDVLTWDFVWEVADKAAEKAEDGTFLLNGQNVMIPFLYKSTDNMMIQMLRQKDAPYSSSDGQILLFNDETRAILETISQHVANGAFSTFKISSYPANFLNAGQCVFAVDSTAGATWMGSDAPLTDISRDKFTAFETAVRMIPQFDPAHPQMISQGPSVCVFNHGDPQEVLASWLFTQYLLSNDVQIAYAQTEGYVPVTSKAQQDSAYLDYISREGEDNDEHYAVKIQASRLMTEHVSDTFVTPAFNGSASLRDAAGQLIESTVKSIRRKQNVDDAYFDKLYEDTIALYHLNQGDGAKGMDGKADLGPLPAMSRYLLIGLCVIWVLIGLYSLRTLLRERRKER